MFYPTVFSTLISIALASSAFSADEVKNTPLNSPTASTVQPVLSNTEASQAKVDLNKATTKDLQIIKNLTPSKARAIVSYRKKEGNFKSLDELKLVKGFKKMDEKTLKELQDQLMIG